MLTVLFLLQVLTWTGQLFFKDRFLRGRTKRSENKDRKESWGQEVLRKLCLRSSEFIKKHSVLYTVCKGKIGQSQQKATAQWDKASRKLIKQCCAKGIQDVSSVSQTEHTAALGLI